MMKAAESTVPRATSQMRGQVHALGQAAPAEQPEAEEGRFEEEGGQAFDGERRAEDVADEARVRRPGHAELELLHEAGDHADRHVDQQQRAEEAREAQVVFVAAAVPERLQDGDQEREADRDRDEQEVVDARRRELQASKVEL